MARRGAGDCAARAGGRGDRRCFTARWRPTTSWPWPSSARQEAADFTRLTNEREQAREAAHADVVKAQLAEQQRERDLADAKLAAEKARLELGVLLFPDPRTPYTLAAPEARAAAGLARGCGAGRGQEQSGAEERAGRAEREQCRCAGGARPPICPILGLNVTYGIDAHCNLPSMVPDPAAQARNLGYSASVTLNIPVWDWLATEHKVKQSEIRRDAAQVALSATQRRLIAQLDEAYSEAAGGARSACLARCERGHGGREPAPDQAALHGRRGHGAGSGGCAKRLCDAPRTRARTGACATRRRGPILQTLTGTM